LAEQGWHEASPFAWGMDDGHGTAGAAVSEQTVPLPALQDGEMWQR